MLAANERMSDWLLVMACLSDHAPTAITLRKQLESKEFANRSQAARRLVVLNREQLCSLFGPTFAERARLFLEPPASVASTAGSAAVAADSALLSDAARRAADRTL